MKRHTVKDIPPNYFFTKPVYLDGKFVVAAPEMPFTMGLIQALLDWNFQEVLSEGAPGASYVDGDAHGTADSVANDTATGRAGGVAGVADGRTDGPVEESVVNLARAAVLADAEKIKWAENFCHELKVYINDLFSAVFMGDPISFNRVAEQVKDFIERIRGDQRYLLRVLKDMENAQEDYLIAHTAKSTIIALIIGLYIKLPPHRLIELGVAALFHEAGMIKLPAKIYLNSRSLSPAEQKLIYNHPMLGYNTLKEYGFPLAVSIAALEHHERENGAGYPRHLTSDKISLYSKIIAVACSYDAISSYRPHREARDEYTGIVELLKNEGKQYDDTIIRALVYSLSIYPIGLYVLLSNGKKGQVVDVNPENPRFPIVQIFGELTPDGKNKTQQTSPEGLRILRPLTREEIGI